MSHGRRTSRHRQMLYLGLHQSLEHRLDSAEIMVGNSDADAECRYQQLAQDEAQVEGPDMNQLPLQDVVPSP